MKELTLKYITEHVGGRLLCGDKEQTVTAVTHDSRSAKENTLFFAIIGERFDGHRFIQSAVEAGCRSCVISHTDWLTDEVESALAFAKDELQLVLVDDTKQALQDLASAYLTTLGVKTIGITGSTGKTSTKDMVAAVCSMKYKTEKTQGNFNNDIGMPLTILSLEEDTQVAVLEMGMDHFGEIHTLVNIAHPDIGLITNIGISHMENLGSREGIMQAKMEITDNFGPEQTLIISTGEDLLRRDNIERDYLSVGREFALITTGPEDGDDYCIENVDEERGEGLAFALTKKENGKRITQEFSLPVPGKHNALNAALAVACGELLGISMQTAAEGLAKMELTAGRLTVKTKNKLTVIDDTYNASPDSMKGALDVLHSRKANRKIAILGDMYELGKDSAEWHHSVGVHARSLDVDEVYAVGDEARFIAEGAGEKGVYYSDKQGCLDALEISPDEETVVLVKGSRGMKMEEIVEDLLGRN